MREERWNELTTFSFFVAVTTIIANLVYEMLGDLVKELSGTSRGILEVIQGEYAFVAVFALFMAMSFALGYVYASKETKLTYTAGEFLDALLVLSLALVIAFYLREPGEITYRYITQVTIGVDVFFFCFMCFIYSAMEKPFSLITPFFVILNFIRALKSKNLRRISHGCTTILALAFLYGVGWYQHRANFQIGLPWSLSTLFILIFFTKWTVNQMFDSTQNKWIGRIRVQGKGNALNMHPAKRRLRKSFRNR